MMHSTREGPCAIAHTQRFFHNGSNMLRQALLVALALGPVAALPKHITVDSRERFVQLGGPYDVSTNGNEDELYIKISRLAAERRNPEGTRAPVRWDRMGLFAQPPDTMEKAIAWLDSTGECVFDTAFAGHYSLFNSSAVQDMARDPSGKHAAEAKYRAAGRMALYFANCDAPDTKVFFKAKVATSKDVLEDRIRFAVFLIIFVPFAIAVKYGMRRACTCRPRRAQRPAPPLLALLQHQDSSLPPGSPSTRAATAAPAPAGAVGGPGAGLGSSSQQQHQQLYVPPDAVAPHADTEAAPLVDPHGKPPPAASV